jgi:3-oxochol-4-en-24-oyl-CoA dehydrogenase
MRSGSLSITADQNALADAVRGFAERERLTAQARVAYDSREPALPPCWASLAAQEILALAFDADLPELCVAVDELGHALAPGPVVPTLLAAVLVRRHASTSLRGVVEAGCRDGTFSAAVAMGDVLVGGSAVSHVMLPVDGRWCVVTADRVAPSAYDGVDGSRGLARATLVPDLPDDGVLTGVDDAQVRALATVLIAAECTGLAAWCLETAVEHAKVREQFGRPIGSFQAVKHRCASMLCRLEMARAAVWDAAAACDGDGQRSSADDLAVAVAGALAPQTAVELAKDAVQVLGGIGFTWEHDAHLYLKRALVDRQVLGCAGPHRRSAALLALGGARRTRPVDLGSAAEAIREEVRGFVASLAGLDAKARRVAIADAGYLVPHWPRPYGRDAGPIEQLVIDEVFAQAQVDRPDLVIGTWALSTILQHGSDAQRARFAPPTLHGDVSWCQLFSEPGAGSDLASLSTKAVQVDGGWSLSGQKVWTSNARTADWAICLARTTTEPDKHHGITYFLVDMRSPGLDVRPLREMTGDAMFNEVFLTDVFVPDDCVVGEVGDGWRLARTTLANERVAMSGGSAFPSGVETLLRVLAGSDRLDDAATLDTVGGLVCLAQADAMLGARTILARVSGIDPGPASSVRKLVGMHLRQDVAEAAYEVLGAAALTDDEVARSAVHRFLANRALTIAGGTSEVLHNVIGERILGLPR